MFHQTLVLATILSEDSRSGAGPAVVVVIVGDNTTIGRTIPFLLLGLNTSDVGHEGEIAVLGAVGLSFLHLAVRSRD